MEAAAQRRRIQRAGLLRAAPSPLRVVVGARPCVGAWYIWACVYASSGFRRHCSEPPCASAVLALGPQAEPTNQRGSVESTVALLPPRSARFVSGDEGCILVVGEGGGGTVWINLLAGRVDPQCTEEQLRQPTMRTRWIVDCSAGLDLTTILGCTSSRMERVHSWGSTMATPQTLFASDWRNDNLASKSDSPVACMLAFRFFLSLPPCSSVGASLRTRSHVQRTSLARAPHTRHWLEWRHALTPRFHMHR